MPYYACTFMNTEGQFSRRDIYATDRKELLAQTAGGEEKLVSARRHLFKEIYIWRLFVRPISYQQFLIFNQELITLIRAGMPILKALEIIIENSKPNRLHTVVKKAVSDIQAGVQISEAFDSADLPFHRIYKASLLAGEKSGHLESILDKFNTYMAKMTQLRRKTISSLTYPVLLLGFMISLFLIITIYVIPKFASIFEQFQATLPPITIFFLEFSRFIKHHALLLAIFVVASFVTAKLIERYYPQIIIIDQLKTRTPFIGKIIKENSLAIFCRTLSILVSGGIPVPESSTIAVEIITNRFLYSRMRHIPQTIRGGLSLSEVLGQIPQIPRLMKEMVKVGEASGNLSLVLDESADHYERSIDNKINTLISLIEPVIIITLGAMIALMLISVYLPIFSASRIV